MLPLSKLLPRQPLQHPSKPTTLPLRIVKPMIIKPKILTLCQKNHLKKAQAYTLAPPNPPKKSLNPLNPKNQCQPNQKLSVKTKIAKQKIQPNKSTHKSLLQQIIGMIKQILANIRQYPAVIKTTKTPKLPKKLR